MTENEIKFDRLREWRYNGYKGGIPGEILPTYNDIEGVLNRDTASINYLSELLVDFGILIEMQQKRIAVLTLQMDALEARIDMLS